MRKVFYFCSVLKPISPFGSRLTGSFMMYSVYRLGSLAAQTWNFDDAVLIVMFLKRLSITAVYEIKDELGNDMMKEYPEFTS